MELISKKAESELISNIIAKLEQYIQEKNNKITYSLYDDTKGYRINFPNFNHDGKSVYLCVSMMNKPIAQTLKLDDIKSAGWDNLFYIYITSSAERKINFKIDGLELLHKTFKLVQQLGTILDLTFNKTFDLDKPKKGSNQKIEELTIVEAPIRSFEEFQKRKTNELQSFIDTSIVNILKNEPRRILKERIINKLIELIPNISLKNIELIQQSIKHYDIDFLELCIKEMESVLLMIKNKVPNTDFNDDYVFENYLRCIQATVLLKNDEL